MHGSRASQTSGKGSFFEDKGVLTTSLFLAKRGCRSAREKPVQAEQKDPSPASDEPWVDPDFPPCAASVGDYTLKKLGGEVRGWAKDGINKDLSKEFCDGSQGTRVELGEVEDVLHSLAAFFPSRPRSTVLSFKIFRSQPW